MKKSPFVIGLFALSFFFTSCDEQKSQTTEESATEESTTSESDEDKVMDGTYVVDVQSSKVNWKGTMIGVYSHTGTLNFNKGKLSVRDGKIEGGMLEVDMNSLQPTDENYEPEEEGKTKKDLVNHLMSDDFFLVSEYPAASFVILGVSGNIVKGEMTIRGNTNTIKVEGVEIHKHGKEIHIQGKTVLDRQNYDVTFSHPMEEMVLSDDLEIEFDITATM